MNVLAIDPGPTESAYALIDGDRRPLWFDKLPNHQMLAAIQAYRDEWKPEHVAIEMVASYGMAVGKEVFDTCVWIGRFAAHVEGWLLREPQLVYRKDIKLHHCYSVKANDSNIRQALVDRFAAGVRNSGKGTKAEPGFFYGFRKDIWQAFALAVYVADSLPQPTTQDLLDQIADAHTQRIAVAHGHVLGDHVRVTGGQWQPVDTLNTDGAEGRL